MKTIHGFLLGAYIGLFFAYVLIAYEEHTKEVPEPNDLICNVIESSSVTSCEDEYGNVHKAILTKTYDRCHGNRWGWKPNEQDE